MKKVIIFSIAVLLTGMAAYAKSVSEAKVPVLVKASFYNDYPKATLIRWEVTQAHDYKAEYELGDKYGNVYYNDKGEFIESDIMVEWNDVPLAGRMNVYQLKTQGHITEVLKIVNHDQKIFYQIGIKNKIKKYEILLDEHGNRIK